MKKILLIVSAILLYIMIVVAIQGTMRSPAAQERAIQEAIDIHSSKKATTGCSDVMTRARHVASGAIYTFSCSALPDGWVEDDAH